VHNAVASHAVIYTKNLSFFYLTAHVQEILVLTPPQKALEPYFLGFKHRGSKNLVQVVKKNTGI
jgi:hypothetical protein